MATELADRIEAAEAILATLEAARGRVRALSHAWLPFDAALRLEIAATVGASEQRVSLDVTTTLLDRRLALWRASQVLELANRPKYAPPPSEELGPPAAQAALPPGSAAQPTAPDEAAATAPDDVEDIVVEPAQAAPLVVEVELELEAGAEALEQGAAVEGDALADALDEDIVEDIDEDDEDIDEDEDIVEEDYEEDYEEDLVEDEEGDREDIEDLPTPISSPTARLPAPEPAALGGEDEATQEEGPTADEPTVGGTYDDSESVDDEVSGDNDDFERSYEDDELGAAVRVQTEPPITQIDTDLHEDDVDDGLLGEHTGTPQPIEDLFEEDYYEDDFDEDDFDYEDDFEDEDSPPLFSDVPTEIGLEGTDRDVLFGSPPENVTLVVQPPVHAPPPRIRLPGDAAHVSASMLPADDGDEDEEDSALGVVGGPRAVAPRLGVEMAEDAEPPRRDAARAVVQLTPPGRGSTVTVEPPPDHLVAASDIEEAESGPVLRTGGLRVTLERPTEDHAGEEEEDEDLSVPRLTDEVELPPAATEDLSLAGPSIDQGRIDEFMRAARDAEAHGDLSKAIVHYRDLLEIDPTHLNGWLGRGRCLMEMGDYAAAMSDFQRAEDLRPESPEPLVEMGNLYFARKEYRRSIDFYDQAIELDATHAMARCRRGICHYYRKNHKQAFQDLQRAYSLDPEIPNIRRYVNMAIKAMERSGG